MVVSPHNFPAIFFFFFFLVWHWAGPLRPHTHIHLTSHFTKASAASFTPAKSHVYFSISSCVFVTKHWAESKSIPLICKYSESGVVVWKMRRNTWAVRIVWYFSRLSANQLAFAHLRLKIHFITQFPECHYQINVKALSWIPNLPKTFLSAASLAHHRVAAIGDSRLCRVSLLTSSHWFFGMSLAEKQQCHLTS